jgi:hypothetical protein
VKRIIVLTGLAVALGLTIAWVDSRPTWDDTGITVAAIFGTALALGAAAPSRPGMMAIALGIWIPVFNIVQGLNYGAVASLVIAFGGSYAGAFLRRAFIAAGPAGNKS